MFDDGHVRESESQRPLSAQTFQILLALVDAERHGYAIMQDVSERTNGELRMSAGTLYGSLKRLLDDGLVVESGVVTHGGSPDERRRYYCLTESGLRAARVEAQRLESLVRCARVKRLLELEPAAG